MQRRQQLVPEAEQQKRAHAFRPAAPQSMTGAGPLSVMDEVELRHWMALAACRAALAGLCAGEAALAGFPSAQAFQVCRARGVEQGGAVLGRAGNVKAAQDRAAQRSTAQRSIACVVEIRRKHTRSAAAVARSVLLPRL